MKRFIPKSRPKNRVSKIYYDKDVTFTLHINGEPVTLKHALEPNGVIETQRLLPGDQVTLVTAASVTTPIHRVVMLSAVLV